MKNINHLIFLFAILSIAFFSCKKDPSSSAQQADSGYNYFPVDTDRYVIYEIDSIAYDDKSHPADTTRYQLKEVIASTFLDNSQRPAQRIERFYRMYNDSVPYDSLPWTGPRVWYANRTSTTAEKVEENGRFLKLVFPVTNGKKWNGNVYNTFNEKIYEVISKDEPETINNNHFDSVVTVKQFEQKNFIEYIYEVEKYARNVGLVYKERDSIYHGGTADSSGYLFRQKVISYGK